MENKEPRRLSYDKYELATCSYRMFHSHLTEPTGIHWHEFYELAFVASGKGVHLLNGTPVPLRRGSLFLLTPTDFHELLPADGRELEVYNIIFSDEVIDNELYPILFNETGAHMHQLEGTAREWVEAEFHFMWSEASERRFGRRRLLSGALERIFVQLIRIENRKMEACSQRASAVFLQPSVNKALIYMQHHFRENITLESVAKQAQLATNYFSEIFKKAVGVTFQNHLQELRVRFARSLLLHAPDLSVTEVCFAAGFGSLPHFERVFKQRTGCTPKAYRSR
jgi:AraC-like DNA-binding protein